MNKAIFQNLQQAVASFLHQSTQSLDIAMCWFSNPVLFAILLKKAKTGIKIRLMIQFDQANFHAKGLPMLQLVEAGGQVFVFRHQNNLLHHKFALVDDNRLLTGSYNWTRTQHADNLLLSNNPELFAAYENEFEQLWQIAEPLTLLAKIKPPAPGFHQLFEPITWDSSDLRQAIIWGARVWISVYKENEMRVWQQCLQMQRHYLKLKADFFERNRGVWNEVTFQEWSNRLSLTKKRLLKNYCIRMKNNDVLVAVSETGKLLGAGLVGSTPEAGHLENYCFTRYVQWFEFPTDAEKLPRMPRNPFSAYRGSGLKLISSLMLANDSDFDTAA